jgi:hypothetical protein
VIHHAPGRATVYCPASQITEGVAEALAATANRAATVLAPAAAGYEISVVRVPSRDLPGGLAQVETCRSVVTVYVCADGADAVGEALAGALGPLATAYTGHLCQAAHADGVVAELRPRLP